ncbi:hypothetical protein NDU88_000794 [Pleurodeles waltl]|uniref:Dimethylargininase n=1 Tax=Pleurodeles waltl TaxID=8319 RepID=A0AAV7Q532_PLEWA|nr:hypothetical protein NDU88_000794 [Pleurodeles waltl]
MSLLTLSSDLSSVSLPTLLPNVSPDTQSSCQISLDTIVKRLSRHCRQSSRQTSSDTIVSLVVRVSPEIIIKRLFRHYRESSRQLSLPTLPLNVSPDTIIKRLSRHSQSSCQTSLPALLPRHMSPPKLLFRQISHDTIVKYLSRHYRPSQQTRSPVCLPTLSSVDITIKCLSRHYRQSSPQMALPTLLSNFLSRFPRNYPQKVCHTGVNVVLKDPIVSPASGVQGGAIESAALFKVSSLPHPEEALPGFRPGFTELFRTESQARPAKAALLFSSPPVGDTGCSYQLRPGREKRRGGGSSVAVKARMLPTPSIAPFPPHCKHMEAVLWLHQRCELSISNTINTTEDASIDSVKKVLEELKLRVVEVAEESATLDGSDVLFTGREFFVGISKWTNHRGAEAVADAFRDFAVSTVPVSGDWHLKDFCSMAGPDTILLGSSEVARRALKSMEQLTDHHYETLTVPDDPAANCIYVRVGQKSSVLVHRSSEEFPESVQTFQKLPEYTLVPAACTEVAKLGGALSSCSLLINKKLEL